ncbi:Clavaminate synthase-like protein, partial [Phaeosphaeriaceae sp. SRC1lsM3a]
MAVLLSESSQHGFSISNIISRFRSKKRSRPQKSKIASQEQIPQDTRPPLINSPIPLVLPEHQYTLPTLGWTTITFPQPSSSSPSPLDLPGPHPLQLAYESLFAASQAFFALPPSEKSEWKHKLGTEEGWSSVPGEKEFITLRSLEYCPSILREPAKRYWDLMGAHLTTTLSRIGTSLGLDGEELTRFVGPCASMQETDALKTATMIRLFRYEGWEEKVVAEPHCDLGLLSVVVGDVPGLEVWDGHGWFDVEREVKRAERKGASMLVGRQLELMSNGRYGAGGHRVVSYGVPETQTKMDGKEEKRYRYSIVFVLRTHDPVMLDSEKLETSITGKWETPMKGITAGKMYEDIRGKHFNINIGVEEREKQRELVKKREKE